MNSPTNRLNYRPSRRAGFTLTELLVVIAIIGLLVGMLAVALGPAIWRTDEAVITQEVVQLDAAIEKFKDKYGFYPPDFTGIDSTNYDAYMAPYLNKISRNHAEFSEFTSGPYMNRRRIDVWWDLYGQFIVGNEQASLVFWLSHLFNNTQFPLTAGTTNSEFVKFFDFKSERLNLISDVGVPDGLPGVYTFLQAKGPRIPYAYFNHQTYPMNSIPHPQGGVAAPYYQDTSATVFYNPERFQIIAAGLDGDFGAGDWFLTGDPTHKGDQDNITNFAEGINAKMLQ